MSIVQKHSDSLGQADVHGMSDAAASGSMSISGEANSSILPARRDVENRLKLVMAIQCCLGGLVLASGQGTELIPVVAIFFAVFGYLFVDLMKLFALPPLAAYTVMTLAGIYSFGQFWDTESHGQPQMIAVGELLVFVQSVLMLQEKSHRIFEQLVVFSLLELVVAAVFNNAIYYGLLLVPMSLLAVYSLCLMSALQSWEGVRAVRPVVDSPLKKKLSSTQAVSGSMLTWSPTTAQAYAANALRYPRLALLMLCPSIILVGLIFFYALPRIGEARRMDSAGQALVGFSDHMHLSQLGQVLQNPTPALRVTLTRRGTIRPYMVNEGIYLRGRVFEQYNSSGGAYDRYSTWDSLPYQMFLGIKTVPSPYRENDPSRQSGYDDVEVDVVCEPMQSGSLFAIPPYFHEGNSAGLVHVLDAWTIQRRNARQWSHPKISYSLGTTAFYRGHQNRLLSMYSHELQELAQYSEDRGMDVEIQRRNAIADLEKRREAYLDATRRFDANEQPTATDLAEQVVSQIPHNKRNPYEIAAAMERYLRDSPEFSYTLNLDAKRIPGMEQTEQFLAVDRKGHCQYFASGLAMMLRSQGLPTRIVAGYHTDEFNEYGGYFVARQLHAHVWVEALVPADSLPEASVPGELNTGGQLADDHYWLRLDPTPTAGRENLRSSERVGQVMDLAKNMWDEYVVDMDANRQDKALLGARGMTPMSESYSSLIKWMQLQIDRIRNGELGGGSLADNKFFSLPGVLLGITLVMFTTVAIRYRFPTWLRRSAVSTSSAHVAEPSIPFFAEALQQVGRLGLHRRAGQTPLEFTAQATGAGKRNLTIGDAGQILDASLARPLALLTQAFYRYRFGLSEVEKLAAIEDNELVLEPEIRQALTDIRTSVDRLTEGKLS